MNKRKIIISSVLASMMLLTHTACKDDFLDKTNINAITSESFYTNTQEGILAVNATYAALQRQGLYQRKYHFVFDLASDEFEATTKTQGPNQQLFEYTWSADHEHISSMWEDWYKVIARANTFLEKSVKIKTTGEDDKKLLNRLVAEARFLRGMAYSNLALNWGGVPLRLETNLAEPQLAVSPVEKIWEQAEADLKFAEANLSSKKDFSGNNVGRATKGAAKAILGRTLIYEKKWAEAATKLKEVIDSGEYQLLADMRKNHSFEGNNSDEGIFEVQFNDNLNQVGSNGAWSVDDAGATSWGGNCEGSFRSIEYGVEGHAFYNSRPSKQLIATFEKDDPRIETTMFGPKSKLFLSSDNPDYNKDNSYEPIFKRSGYAWKKYQSDNLVKYNNNEPAAGGINHRVIRLGDVYLLYAEALINTGNATGGLDYINRIRRRADPSGKILADRKDATKALEFLKFERNIEMAGEQSRRIDVVRWGDGVKVFGTKFVTGKHEIFPIPQAELNSNALVKQNKGY
jgi:starch-binding outer membrane protein, SusD/RagB family